ncbi:MAG TPA: efflux RND transporter periplasmic adaptor subunit, partial [Nitrospirota bacterium]|nr:efflux RND transporter periplasmic adaptor subunit [Nitrospirota bacterium]
MKKNSQSIILAAGLILGIGIGALIMFYVRPGGVNKDAGSAVKDKKVLFYRNPMNPAVTSSTPAKDNMGMDYIPVYEGEEDAAGGEEAPGTVRISTEKIQKIGGRSEVVKRRTLRRVIRTVGRVDPDETKVFIINAKVGGWVERLYINRTDQMVEHHEP